MRALVVIVAGFIVGLCHADDTKPYAGSWNVTYSPHGPDSKLCMKLQAGIRMDISYDTHNGTKTATIVSTNHTTVGSDSHCENATTDQNESLVLNFKDHQKLSLYFTRDHRVTKDDNGNRWQLYKVEFAFEYDNETFPDSIDSGDDDLSNKNSTILGISTSKDRSFSCSRTGTIVVTERFNITMTNLRVQAYMTGDDFSPADHCAIDQETTDLIPIIIGAALAALVIIVLVAYLIGRARANTPAYDNMK